MGSILLLLPPVVVMVLAVKTKNTTASLLIGTVLCCIIQYKTSFLTELINMMYTVGCSEDTVWYILFVSFFGAMIGIWSRTGATNALAAALQGFATSARKTMIVSFILGIVTSVDDYTSMMAKGTMNHLYDKNKIPRGEASFVSAATASPACALIPFGTWGVFYLGSFASYEEVAAYGSGMALYVKIMPYIFYSIIIIAIALLFCLGIVKPVGKMKKARQWAIETGELYDEESKVLNTEEDEDVVMEKSKMYKLLLELFVPLVLFVYLVVTTGDSLLGIIIAFSIAVAIAMVFRLAKWTELMAACMSGLNDMLPMIIIVFGAYMFRDGLYAIGLPEFTINAVRPFMSAALIPVICFLVTALLGFFSGAGWGISLALLPIVVPLCDSLNGNMLLAMGATVSGAVFALTTCIYSDCNVFNATCLKINSMEHAMEQLPFNFVALAISSVAYLIAGFIL